PPAPRAPAAGRAFPRAGGGGGGGGGGAPPAARPPAVPAARRVGVAALLVDLGRGGPAPSRDEEREGDDQADHAPGHQDVADYLQVDAVGCPGHGEPQNGADDDERDASANGHELATSSRPSIQIQGHRLAAGITRAG